jgi:type III restriction enzyme
LHLDLNNAKENSLTYEDFKDQKIVLIADEAHHISAGTRQGNLFGSWEGTVVKILEQNFDNILLEFTATLDYESAEISKKYQNKVIHKYDLAQFRKDKYSKEISLIRSLYNEEDRIIQALILNLYRQELATSNNINLKPVILFKAKRTIKESEENKINFHKLIDNFSNKMVENIKKTSTIPIVQKAFSFFESNNLSTVEVANRIKANFREENCISANNDKEAELNQIRLNTLEDENNPIRAIFAVQKLNEGWDVLNLFDIVRLYDGQNTGGSNKTIGKTTLSEAQLIGRGARYFPFSSEGSQDKYTRKYDNNVSNELKILEELYYHTKEDNRYIAELKKALIESGIYEDEDKLVSKELIIKPSFKETDFYKTGKVVFNKKIPKSYDNVKSFADLGIFKKNFNFTLSSGAGSKSNMFLEAENIESNIEHVVQQDILVSSISKHIIQFALTQNPFFYFDNLERYFPNTTSLSNFIKDKSYLGGLEITFTGTKSRINAITSFDYLLSIQGLLQEIELDIKTNSTEYEGSSYIQEHIHRIFKNKTIMVPKDSEKADGQFEIVNDPDWYVFNANYGTSEEKEFVKMFARRFDHLSKRFDNIYLIRNEREIKIFDELGRAFEPDFVLFCKQKEGSEVTYQVFIEPKGNHLKAHDKWKEDFLAKLRKDKITIDIDSDKYLITGVPFYNYETENEFKKELEGMLDGISSM